MAAHLKRKSRSSSHCDTTIELLSPKYIEQEHKVYVDEIEKALRSESCRNLALSGPYGSGKSSILSKVVEMHGSEAVSISLSTLGNQRSSRTPSSRELSEEASSIQKEIIKQLLYMADPRELPRSRFNRLHKAGLRRSLRTPSFISLILVVLLLTTNTLRQVPDFPLDGWNADNLIKNWINFVGKSILVWLIGTIVLWRPVYLVSGRVRFDKLTAGPASIAFDDRPETYFDKYLDEIIYYFEETKHRIVIFEDLDRFDNPEIFEQLRALNTVLNNAQQLRRPRWGRRHRAPIVFIYATRDSIFEQPESAATSFQNAKDDELQSSAPTDDKAVHEIERSNRTKFFDLVIPVVPFITHRNARDALRKQMRTVSHAISSELIDLAARHIPDYRTLVSVRGEYEIYANKILCTGSPDLRPDSLFAMMLYKAVHLKDFEDIRLGQSNLDAVYLKSRELIEHEIVKINGELDEIERKLGGGVLLSERAQELGKVFIELTQILSSTSGYSGNPDCSVDINGTHYDQKEMSNVEPWRLLAETDGSTVTFSYNVNVRDPHCITRSFLASHSLNRQQLSELMKMDLDTLVWEKERREQLSECSRSLSERRQRLRHYDMKDLMEDGDVHVTLEEAKVSFSGYVRARLGSDMAAALVQHGYIDRNFALYCSTYDETALSANAMTFLLRHVEPNSPNVGYPLDEKDIEQLLRDLPANGVAQSGCYNANILAYLLTPDPSNEGYLNQLLAAIVNDGDDERSLLQAYFEHAANTETEVADGKSIRLVTLLAPKHFGLFEVLANLTGVNDRIQRQLVDVAMMNCAPNAEYRAEDVRDMIEQHYREFEGFTGEESDSSASVARVLALSGAKLQDVSPLRGDLYDYVNQSSSYTITRQNLELLAGDKRLNLDDLATRQPAMYAYMLDNLDDYLDALHYPVNYLSALHNTPRINKVFHDLAGLDGISLDTSTVSLDSEKVSDSQVPAIKRILDNTRTEFTLEFVPPALWPIVADQGNLDLSMENIQQYIERYGVDRSLASLLKEREPHITANDPQSDYTPIAKSLLEARDVLTAERRVALVQHLRTEEEQFGSSHFRFPLTAEQVETEDSLLVGLLLDAGLIEDTAATFELTQNARWKHREFAIAKSTAFSEYMNASVVDADAARIVGSKIISDEIKRTIAGNIQNYCSNLSSEDLSRVAEYAVDADVAVDLVSLRWLVSAEVEADIILRCIAVTLDALDDNDVLNLIDNLGEPYLRLSQPGGRQRVDLPASLRFDRVLDRLKRCGGVSSWQHDDKKNQYRVNLRRK